MNVQSCSTLFSSWTPISGSEVTSWPLWRQCKVVILSTRAAVQWKGSRSPLKTTWRCDGSSDSVCSSRGPSERHGGKKEADVTVTHRSELFLPLSHYPTSARCFHRSYYESAVLEQIGCRQRQFINATHRISCQHSSLILLEICPRWATGIDLCQPFWSTNSSNYWDDLEWCNECTVIVIHKQVLSESGELPCSSLALTTAQLAFS